VAEIVAKRRRSVRVVVGVAAVALTALLTGEIAASAPVRPVLSVPILMYHRIDVLKPSLPPMTRRLTVDPNVFRQQMRWLVRNGYRSVTQAQLQSGIRGRGTLPKKPVMITFDDGYADVYTRASPILTRLGLHATAYLITSRISGPDPSFLTWQQVRGLERRGIQIGSHTETHAALPSLSSTALLEELRGGRRALQRVLHHPVPWLAYPYGAYDERVVDLARASGYTLGVTTVGGTCQTPTRPLELRRLEVLDTTSIAGLRTMLAARC
jgi:peptidoglycan/xylan/chitin deacetylase (PgdA/CDA1 family)